MNILNLAVLKLLPGMIIGENIYNKATGEKVILKNTIISPKVILKLKMNGIQQVIVMIPDSMADKLTDETPAENVNKVKDSTEFKKFRSNYLKTTSALKESFLKIIDNKSTRFDTGELLSTIDILSEETTNSMRTFELLQCMRDYDDLTYVHSLNVALIAKAFGGWLNFSDEGLRLLTVAGLLHDIGKTMIPEAIIKKPGALTNNEYDIIKKHPSIGYKIVKDVYLDNRVKAAILLHHERSNGSGYPKGLKNDDIPPFAKIIAISDVYDAMTASRVYRDAICPFDVVAKFENSYSEFDITFLLQFLEHIVEAYIHAPVQLSNTQIGEIVMINKHHLSAPIVKVDGKFYDLSRDKALTIKKVL